MRNAQTYLNAPPAVMRAMVVAAVALAAFLAIPWVLMACHAVGMPGWIYGAEPMVGWLRLYALLPVWLLLIAVAALGFAIVRAE